MPAPQSVLSYDLGTRLVTHADAGRYIEALAAASDRVRLFSYARSHEGRLLRYAVISSSSNIARLASIRASLQEMAGSAAPGARSADEILRDTPVVVWLSYAVHGDEHSSTEAALAVAYHLASARDARTQAILDQTVVIIDPIQNPDGRDRFIQSYAGSVGTAPSADPYAAEHDEPWPSGRVNHDLFDLNRDWIWQTQPETRGKIAAFLAWRPQVYVDAHEMGSDETYYFAPPARPINTNVPESILRWFQVIGQANARAFDALGFDYFTGEVYDLFYPGYGDAWPTLNDAIGMTFEQATPAGFTIERKDGGTLTLRDAIRHHVASSLTTAETAAAHRQEILRDFQRSRRAAIAGRSGMWVIPADAGGERLAALLAAQGISVLRSAEEFGARAARVGGDVQPRRFPPGSFVLPAGQPSGSLLAALMEVDPKIDERTLKEATERRRLREALPFYDVTSWSVALAAGVPAYRIDEAQRAAGSPVARPSWSVSGELPGHEQPPTGFTPWPPPIEPALDAGAASRAIAEAEYAYLLPPSGEAALRALVELLRTEGVRVQVAMKGFAIRGVTYAPGTAVLKVRANPGTLHATIEDLSRRLGARFEAASSGRTEEGIDLGSGSVLTLAMPRVAMLYGEPASATSAGWLRYVLDERMGIPVAPLRARALGASADLRRYDVILLPDGGARGYAAALDTGARDRLKAWMQAGGTLVTLRGASAFAADKDVGWTSSRLVKRPRPAPLSPIADGPAAPKPEPPAPPAPDASKSADAESPDEAPPERIPGAILRVLLEATHPIAFGYGTEVPVLQTSGLVFSLSKDGANPAVFAPADRLRVGGFAWKESLDLLAGKAYVVVERSGRGRAVLFAEDPNFRGGWDGLTRLLLNAILLVPAME